MSRQMPVESVQMQMVRRYARIMRQQQAQFRGPRIGVLERRFAKDTAQAVGEVAGSAAQRALQGVRPPEAPAT